MYVRAKANGYLRTQFHFRRVLHSGYLQIGLVTFVVGGVGGRRLFIIIIEFEK